MSLLTGRDEETSVLTSRATSGSFTETERQLGGGNRAYWKLQSSVTLQWWPTAVECGQHQAASRPARQAVLNRRITPTNTPPELPHTPLTGLQCRINWLSPCQRNNLICHSHHFSSRTDCVLYRQQCERGERQHTHLLTARRYLGGESSHKPDARHNR